jgi:hypothetical protein
MLLKKFQHADWEEVMRYLAVIVGATNAQAMIER